MEMALIKLATLTPVVPVDELLERLDELQRRLGSAAAAAATGAVPRHRRAARAGGAGAGTARNAARRSQRRARAALHAQPPPRRPRRWQTAPDHSWDDFLAFVGKQKVSLLPRTCAPASRRRSTAPSLALRVPAGHYHDYLAQRDHTQLVEDLAQQFFGRPLRVTVQRRAARPRTADRRAGGQRGRPAQRRARRSGRSAPRLRSSAARCKK